jgi:hypothetical protein
MRKFICYLFIGDSRITFNFRNKILVLIDLFVKKGFERPDFRQNSRIRRIYIKVILHEIYNTILENKNIYNIIEMYFVMLDTNVFDDKSIGFDS